MARRRILLVVAVIVAALGAGLVFVYAQGADNRAQNDAVATTRILVATQEIEVGELATTAYSDGKIAFEDVPTTSVITGATGEATSFTDKVALTTIYPGEQLLTEKFGDGSQIAPTPLVPVPDGDQLLTINLSDVNHVGPFLQPGSHVTLWYVPAPQDDGTTTGNTSGANVVPLILAKVLIPDVLVLSVGSTTTSSAANATDGSGTSSSGTTIASAPTTTIGLAVDPTETAIIGGASFNSANAQTIFMTLVQGKNKLKKNAQFSGVTGAN